MTDIIKPSSDPIFITPVMANEWLARNTRNRLINDRYVSDLARDMSVPGAWVLNGEAIKIAVNGDVLDGQHRLLACLLAGVPFESFVVVNLPVMAQNTMDGGRKRTHGDRYRIAGETNPNVLASVVKGAWKWTNGDRRLSSNPNPTQTEMDALLAAEPRLRRSVEIGMRAYGEFRFIPPTAIGIAHFIISGVSPEEAPAFFQRYIDGAEIPVGHPIHTLRKRAMSDKMDNIRLLNGHMVGYLLYTWNHYVTRLAKPNYTLAKFAYQVTDGIPEPKTPKTAYQEQLDAASE